VWGDSGTGLLETYGPTGLRSDRWRDLGGTEYDVCGIRLGIMDLPVIRFNSGVVLPAIPQSEEDLDFRREDLHAGFATGIYEEVSTEEVREVVGVHGADGVVGFHCVAGRGSRAEGSLRNRLCATESALAEKVGQDGNVAAIRAGPGQERYADELGCDVGAPTLHPAHADARLLRVSLRWAFLHMCRAAFGWRRSALLFTKLMRPVVKHLRRKLGYRVLPWIDDFYARLPTVVAPPLGATVAGRANDSRCCSGSSDSPDTRTRGVGKGCMCWNIWESCWTRATCGCS
jgi:hypothetical protein